MKEPIVIVIVIVCLIFGLLGFALLKSAHKEPLYPDKEEENE
jgi:hypothetical protein